MPDLVVCRLDPADPVLGGVNVLGEDARSACHRRKENGEGDPHSERGDGGKVGMLTLAVKTLSILLLLTC
jgi:hypothetical protein